MNRTDLTKLVLGIVLCSLQGNGFAALEQVGRLVIGFGAGKGNIVVRGGYAYVAPGEGDFAILDIRDKANPQLADTIPSTFFPWTIVPYRDFLYFHNRDGQVHVVDAGRRDIKQIPLHRDRQGTVRFADEELGVLVAADRDSIWFFSLEHPLTPKRVSQIATPGSAADKGALKEMEQEFIFTGSGRAVISAERAGIDRLNRVSGLVFSDPRNPELFDLLSLNADEELAAASGSRLAVMDRKNGRVAIYTYDLASRQRPKRYATLALPEGCGQFLIARFHKEYLYVLDGKRGPYGDYALSYRDPRSRWIVYEIGSKTDRAAPSYIYDEDGVSVYVDLTIDGDYAYVRDYNFGVRIFSLAAPGMPKQIGRSPVPDEPSGVYVNRDRKTAYVWSTRGGAIYSVDVADPSAPKRLGYYWDGSWVNYASPSYVRADVIDGKGDTVYCSRYGVAVIDVSDPANMKRTAFLSDADGEEIYGFARLKVEGDRLYMITTDQLLIYDIRRPRRPSLIGTIAAAPGAADFAVRNKIVYTLNNVAKAVRVNGRTYNGWSLTVIDASRPEQPVVVSRLPVEPRLYRSLAVGARGSAYLVVSDKTEASKFMVVDVADPGKPKALGLVTTGSRNVSRWYSWAFFNTNMCVDDAAQRLFLCKYCQVEVFDISRPATPRFLEAKATGHFQWTVGPKHGDLLYLPDLRGLYILRYTD